MQIEKYDCDCCGETTHSLTIPSELVEFDGENFSLNLADDDLMDLYQTCKQLICQ